MSDIRYRGTKAKLLWFLKQKLPALLSGREFDPFGLGQACLLRVAKVALEDVREDFLTKARGDAGADGTVWAPLSPETIRRRRARRGVSGTRGPSARGRQGASDAVLQTRQEIYRQEYRRLRAGGISAREARKMASNIARFMARNMATFQEAMGRGAEGMASAGGDDELILVDLERLLLSVSPGEVSPGLGGTYDPPTEDQSVTVERGTLTVESLVPYGDAHMYDGVGSATGTFRPARPWKYGEAIPVEWFRKWVKVYAEALAELLPSVVARLDEL